MFHKLQSLGQGVFLRIESLFNAAFGDRHNPLYFLGAITYFLLWIVIFTGLYLYAFFETSAVNAYASVEAMTHGQRYAGGVLRSVHRYASDGMVLGMLLHLARHFVFDHHRGFRWFSWISGLALLWMAYASGINGYMLPWDRLAQFVVTATAEWFDALPMFSGSLARNFLYDASVSDRLFSLLSFVHIGLPLALLAVLWVHTQRVPRATTHPPRQLMAGVLLMLVVLSLFKPALSQPPAELATLAPAIEFDWFYLPAYALLYKWDAARVWMLVGGATFVFALLPWLPPRRRGSGFSIAIHPDERIVFARSGETLLEAGLREGLPMPFECRNGGCGECKGTVLYGEVKLGMHQESALSAAERAQGKTLFCCAEALCDLEIEYVPQPGMHAAPVKQHVARVEKMQRLSHDVMLLRLRSAGAQTHFHAGQYINILLDNGEKRSFSFASAPHAADGIELQVRLIPGGRFTTQVFTAMKEGDALHFEGPLGAFYLREDSVKPIIFVAGSTGFAPVKSMLEHAFHTGLKRRMILYWGVRSRRDLYHDDLARKWALEHDNFSYIPVLSEPRSEDRWQGRTGLVHEAILADHPDLSAHQIYACGSVQMVEAIQPAFAAHGMGPDDCFSDAFHLAPQRALSGVSSEMVKLGGSGHA